METPSDGGVTKKGVVIRTSPTTALVAELRAPLGNDATETVTPGSHRMCDWGVLLYKIDVTILNSYGTVKVLDAMPGSTAAGCTGDVDIATLGKGQGDGPSHFEDPETGTQFDVLSITDGGRAAEGHPRAYADRRHPGRGAVGRADRRAHRRAGGRHLCMGVRRRRRPAPARP